MHTRKRWLAHILLAAVLCLTSVALPFPASADQFINGHYKRDGTYVRPHFRSDPDGVPQNNYSFPGNRNPYTGNVAPGNTNTYLKNYYGERAGGLYGQPAGSLPPPVGSGLYDGQ